MIGCGNLQLRTKVHPFCFRLTLHLGAGFIVLNKIQEFIDLLIDTPSISVEMQKRAEAKIADINEKMRILRRMKKTLLQLTNTSCDGDDAVSDPPVLESISPTHSDK